MKKMLLSLSFLVLSTQVGLACSQPEAQFIGKVSEMRKVRIDQNFYDCYYKIEFSSYQESGVCPLDYNEAKSAEFQDDSCTLELGNVVSGYLVKREGKIIIDNI